MRHILAIIFLFLFCVSKSFAQDTEKADVETQIKVEKLSDDINSPFDEITPVLSSDGNELYFTRVGADDYQETLFFQGKDLFWKMSYNLYLKSLRKTYEQISGLRISDPIHSKYNQDIWVAKLNKDGTVGKVKGLPYPANNALPNSLCTTTPNPNTFVVINQFFPKGGMQPGFSIIRKQPNGEWDFPEPIFIEGFKSSGQEVNLTLSKNGTIMLLSMSRHDSKGLNDLYVSFIKPSGSWSYPINLGNAINSGWQESSPYLASDNKTLFFSSNRRDIFRGANIYSSTRLDDTWQHWSKPVLLVRPINSHADDGQPVFNFETNMLFFSSNREGNSNIYRVKIEHITTDLETDEKEYVAIDGRVVDQNGWLLPGAKIMYRPFNFDKFKEATIAEDGSFSLRVPKGKKIHLVAKLENYKGEVKHLFYRSDYLYFKSQFITLHMTELNAEELTIQSQLLLEQKSIANAPIVREKAQTQASEPKETILQKRKGRKIELKPIYFERSRDRILTKSYAELNKLAKLLKKHPTMEIRVEGHTDANGKANELIKLSKDRAVAIKAYLINRGIDESRITSVGFGGQYPVTSNETERDRRKNRRVEVYVINKIEGLEFSELNGHK